MNIIPKCFISYSHDNEEHKEWVLNLSTRLMANGVDVILDQWDLKLGSDLPYFMEDGLSSVDRVISICSDSYVDKANKGNGGVGYEKMILTASLMKNIKDNKIIPIIRSNSNEDVVPIFLSSKLYLDFRDEEEYEKSYTKLIEEIHKETIKARPPVGQNPFISKSSPIAEKLLIDKTKYISPSISNIIEFDYSNNNGVFNIGQGDFKFDIKFSTASNDAIHMYTSSNLEGLAIAYENKEFNEIKKAEELDYSSHSRTPKLNEIIIILNKNGYFAAIKIIEVKSRSHGMSRDNVKFEYMINTKKESTFN